MASIILPHQADATAEWDLHNQMQTQKTLDLVSKVRQIRVLGLESTALRYLKQLRAREQALALSTRLILALTLLSCKAWQPVISYTAINLVK